MITLKHTLVALLSFPWLIALPACDKSKDKSEEKTKKPEKKAVSTLFTGAKVTMPSVLGGVIPGMSADEAKAANPKLAEDDTIKSPEYPDIWFNVDIDKDSKQVSRVYFNLPGKEALAAAKASWGDPQETKDSEKVVAWWFNSETGLRMSLQPGYDEGEVAVEFTYYLPVATFLGESSELAFMADAPLLGMSAADLRAKYAKMLVDEGKDEDLRLDFPPFEWGMYWTRVHFMWDEASKIKQVYLQLSYGENAAAKAELLALLTKKWGEPKQVDEYGTQVMVFSEDPLIKVKDDAIMKGWDFSVAVAEK